MALLISANKVSKSYAGKTLFREVSFGIEEGERVTLLGPNGVGKSTLLKIINKQETADSGDIVHRRGLRIAFLPQSPQFAQEDTILSKILKNYDMEGEDLARAYEWIGKLELNQFDESTHLRALSGGWQKKAALAVELIKNPDLLILDEPTNHLDVPSIKWLEDFFQDVTCAILMVTHDRLFLQRVSQRILDLDPRFPGHLISVSGGYQKYLETKEQMQMDQRSREQKMTNTLRREKEWLARGAKARQTKQQARISSAGDLAQEVTRLKTLNRIGSFNIEFGGQEKGPKKLIVGEAISKVSYRDPNRWLFKDLNIMITPKTRLALMGLNGAGKSTLIKVLLEQVPTDSGKLKVVENLKFAYFEQGRDTLIPQRSVLLNICPEGDYVDFRGTFVHSRSYLERFGFDKNRADLPVAQLSGGEQARLRIAQMMLKSCQVLILDEPTNDLDIDTLNVLEESLRDFDGAVILVTHDRYFMDQVCNQILSFNPYLDSQESTKGELLMFADYEQWEAWYEAFGQLQKLQESGAATAAKAEATKPNLKKLSFNEKFEFDNMQDAIGKLEARLAVVQAELENPEVAANPKKLEPLYSESQTLQADIEAKYARWSELEVRAKI